MGRLGRREGQHQESRLSRTTAVGMYPGGASPQGVLDLAGNVWEWCLTDYGRPGDGSAGSVHRDPCSRMPRGDEVRRVVRGGSWNARETSRAAPTATTPIPASAAAASGSGWCVAPPFLESPITDRLNTVLVGRLPRARSAPWPSGATSRPWVGIAWAGAVSRLSCRCRPAARTTSPRLRRLLGRHREVRIQEGRRRPVQEPDGAPAASAGRAPAGSVSRPVGAKLT